MKKTSIVFLTTLSILADCSSLSEQSAPPPSHETESPAAAGTVPQQKNQSYTLSYQESDVSIPLTEVEPNVQTTLLSSSLLSNSQVEIYRVENDDETVYAAISLGSHKYQLGQVGYSLSQAADIAIEEVTALSHSYIKITGFCGANCPVTNYVQVDAGGPEVIRLEAHTTEADVDHDGVQEIIATVGTAAETYIYKLADDHIAVANVNELLDAVAVTYDRATNQFKADTSQGGLSSWTINKDALQLIP